MATGVVCHYESPGRRGCMWLGLSHLFGVVIASTSIHLVTVTTTAIKQKLSFLYSQIKGDHCFVLVIYLLALFWFALFLYIIFVYLKCVYFCLFLWCGLLHQYYIPVLHLRTFKMPKLGYIVL